MFIPRRVKTCLKDKCSPVVLTSSGGVLVAGRTSIRIPSLLSDMEIILLFLSRHNVDACCITESHLRTNEKFSIPGYRAFTNARIGGTHGGSAILLRNHTPAAHEPNESEIENTTLITRINNQTVRLVAAYSAPRKSFTKQDFEKIIHDDNIPAIVIGDFNALHYTWNATTTNNKGKTLNEIARRLNGNIHAPPIPTRYHNRGRGNTLDIAIAFNWPWTTTSTVQFELNSDNFPVVLQIEHSTPIPLPSTTVTALNRINWARYRYYIEKESAGKSALTTEHQINDAIDAFNQGIYAAIDKSQFPTRNELHKNRLNLPRWIRQLLQEKYTTT